MGEIRCRSLAGLEPSLHLIDDGTAPCWVGWVQSAAVAGWVVMDAFNTVRLDLLATSGKSCAVQTGLALATRQAPDGFGLGR
jgi:hypothetical protein